MNNQHMRMRCLYYFVGVVPLLILGSSINPKPAMADSETRGKPYAKLTLKLTDQALQDADFTQFREQLRTAVKNRDEAFLKQVAADDIRLTFGIPYPLSKLNLEDPNAQAWKHLERAINTGCALHPRNSSESVLWACPHAFIAPKNINHIDVYEQIFVVGADVTVRSQPSLEGEVVTSISHQVLKIDPDRVAQMSQEQLKAKETWAGWTPVVLPDGQRGYVSSRYAFSPIGYRTFFQKETGKWRMTVFIAGD